MKGLKPAIKKASKHERERKVLLGLVEYYIKTGKPVGSNTLKEMGFADLSSATIRNYFAHLEEEGLLQQQHSSGGRIPTDKAYRFYASENLDDSLSDKPTSADPFGTLQSNETREITLFLQNAAERLSALSKTAVFLSAPYFEQDFITGIRLMALDATRCLCALITDFGEVRTEVLHIGQKLSAFTSKRLEDYFNWRLNGQNKPVNLTKEEDELAQKLYNELMVRYIVTYSQINNEEIYRTGFSTLLTYSEFHDPLSLSHSLSLFEHTQGMRLLLKECCKLNTLKFWIGDDLIAYSPHAISNCAVLATPYCVNTQAVGAIGLLGPTRLPYRTLFALLRECADTINLSLTRNLYKFKINMRQPKQEVFNLAQQEFTLIGQTCRLLLEDKSSLSKEKKTASTPAARRK